MLLCSMSLTNNEEILISRKSNRLELKLGNILCKMKKEFFTLSDGFHGNKENSIFAFTIFACTHFIHFAMLNNL